MGELINLFQSKVMGDERLTSREEHDAKWGEWESGMPLSWQEMADFCELAEDLAKASDDHDAFVRKMNEIREVVNSWPRE
jgi:hypothetical protein